MKRFNAKFGCRSVRFLYLAGAACFLLAHARWSTDSPAVTAAIPPIPLSLTADRASFLPRLVTQPIETIRVGQRLVSVSPDGAEDLALGRDDEIDPALWRRLELLAPKTDGTAANVVLLRPLSWIEEQGAAVNKQIRFAVPECGIRGVATVRAIDPCPQLDGGTGRLVIGTYHHESATVFDVTLASGERFTGTGNHPIWSAEKGEYVALASLGAGDRVGTVEGSDRVVSVKVGHEPHSVYNLEIAVTHTYTIGSCGIIVHNGHPGLPILNECAGDLSHLGPPPVKPGVPGREQGKRMTSKDDPLSQLEEIEKAQRKVRQGKSKQVIDNIEKSEQRAKNRLKDIARDPDSLDDF